MLISTDKDLTLTTNTYNASNNCHPKKTYPLRRRSHPKWCQFWRHEFGILVVDKEVYLAHLKLVSFNLKVKPMVRLAKNIPNSKNKITLPKWQTYPKKSYGQSIDWSHVWPLNWFEWQLGPSNAESGQVVYWRLELNISELKD